MPKKMLLAMTVFFFIALLILAIGHLPIYLSIVKFFNIIDPIGKRIAAYSILGLMLSIFVSTILIRNYDNLATRLFYHLSSSWMGIASFLFAFSVLAWSAVYIQIMLDKEPSYRFYAWLMVILTIAYTAYGTYNFRALSVKQITVPIKGLPAVWRAARAVQISDIHLGVTNGRERVQEIADKINAINPDIVFITGDLFDGFGDDLRNSLMPLTEIHPRFGAYYVFGNHEIYLGPDKVRELIEGRHIKLLENEVAEIAGMQIAGLAFARDGQKIDIQPALKKLDPDKPSIALFHAPVQTEEIKKAGVNLQLSGHTHKGQLWPFNYITYLIFKGRDYGLFTDGDYSLYTSSGTGVWGPPMRTSGKSEIVEIRFVDK